MKIENWKLKILSFRAQSLIEIVVGIGIIGVVFTSVGGLIFAALKSAKLSRERSLAQSLVNNMSSGVKSIVNYDWHALWSSAGGLNYWSFDDGAGSANNNAVVIDEISGSNGAISLGSTGNTSLAQAWQDSANCKAGQCLDFDGADDWVSAADSDSLDITGPITISAWIKPETLSGYDTIISKRDAAAIEANYALRTYNDEIQFYWANSGWQVKTTSAANLTTGEWYHLAATYDGSTVNIYKNGSLENSTCTNGTCNLPLLADTNGLTLGRAGDYASEYFDGLIDEVRVYEKVLPVDEISALYSYPGRYYLQNNAGIWQVKHGQVSSTVSNVDFTSYFTLSSVQRDTLNNIVSSGGSVDPTTKKASFIVSWSGGYSMNQEEYVSRTSLNNVFTQTDWSGGPGQVEPVFTAVKTFDTATTGVIYSTSGRLTAASSTFGGGSTGMNSTYHWAWNDVAGWFDFIDVTYNSSAGAWQGMALSMNCIDTSCASSNYKVYLVTSPFGSYVLGDLYGYAWNDNVGWFSFNCDQTGVGSPNNCGTSNYKVNMNMSTGVFTGYAWNDVIGWVSFNCADAGVCGSSDYKVIYDVGSGVGTFLYLVSPIFDTQIEKGGVPLALVWQGSLGTNTAVKFQLASSNSKNGPWSFVGSDGTADTYYPSAGSSQPNAAAAVKPKYHYNQRYFRYKVFLQATVTETPTINDISIVYNK